MQRFAPHRRGSLRAAALVLTFFMLSFATLHAGTAQDTAPGALPGVADTVPRAWDHELDAGTYTQLVFSGNGETLLVGSSMGDILFLDAATGEPRTTLHGSGHGAVVALAADHSGRRGVAVYEDGLVDALDTRQGTPLLPPGEEGGSAAALSADGTYLAIAGESLRLYRAADAPPNALFEPAAVLGGDHGHHLFIHPVLRLLAAVDGHGNLSIFGFTENFIQRVYGPQPLPALDAPVAALTFSADGSRLAVLDTDRNVKRYAVEQRVASGGPAPPELILDFEERLRTGAPGGILLSPDGSRIVAWNDRDILWSEGRNRNAGDEEMSRTRAMTEHLRPPFDAGHRFGHVHASENLSRLIIGQMDGDGRALPQVYAFPGARPGGVFTTDRVDGGLVAIHPNGTLAYGTLDLRLAAYGIQGLVYEAPGDAPWQGAGPSGIFGIAWRTLLIYGGISILAVAVATGAIVAGLSRRGEERRILAELELPEGPLAPPPPPAGGPLRGGGAARAVRPVTPSAPAEAAPPDGLLVLSGFTIPGHPVLAGLTIALTRPGVVRIAGRSAHLERFAAALEGRVPARGVAATGGADRHATPVLFSRHLEARLPRIDDPRQTTRTLHDAQAARKDVPRPVAARRLTVDLGWMGERLDQAYTTLAPLEQWKVRLALAFLHRPKVLLLRANELPNARSPSEQETVRRVLAAVTRHYRALILLIDPEDAGPRAETPARRYAHEEVRLTPTGFRDRVLLANGTPLSGPRHRQ